MNNQLHKRMPKKWVLILGSVVVMLSLVISLFVSHYSAKAAYDFTISDSDDKVVGLEIVVSGNPDDESVKAAKADFGNNYTGLVFDFYKIATVENMNGYESFQFKLAEAYKESLKDFASASGIVDTDKFEGGSRANNATGYLTNSKWGEFTNAVSGVVLGAENTSAFTLSYDEPADKERIVENGAGLYLMVPHGYIPDNGSYYETIDGIYGENTVVTHAYSPERKYTFAPELVSFPSYKGDVTKDNATINDITYNLTGKDAVVLKYIAEDREVYIDIVKTLDTHEEDKKLKEPETVVFSVYATKDDKVVFDSVYAMEISNASTDEIKHIGPIPPLSDVTVVEEYAGAGYKCIKAAEPVEKISADIENVFEFTNTYDDTKGGGSVVNKFTAADATTEGAFEDGNGHFWELTKGFHNAVKKDNK